MARTITEMVDNITQVFAHPSGLQLTHRPKQGSGVYTIATAVEYDEPLLDTLDDLAGRVMGALVALAIVSGAADYDDQHPGDGSTTERDLEDVCRNQPVTSTTLASLMLQLDPTWSSLSARDLHLVLSSLAGSSLQVDITTPPPPAECTRTRFICFTYFNPTRSETLLGYTLQYTFTHPTWSLARL